MNNIQNRVSLQTTEKESSGISSPELFFDLIFAFAVSQLSSHLFHHFHWRGLAETFVMMISVLLVWIYTSWSATWIEVGYRSTKWMLLVVMFLGLFMNAMITKAFNDGASIFVSLYLIIQLGRTVWTVMNTNKIEPAISAEFYKNHNYHMLYWMLATAPLWFAGVYANNDDRLLWWSAAAGIDLLGTWFAHPVPGKKFDSQYIEMEVNHMQERCGLFLLIALGETVLTTGIAAESSMTLSRIASSVFGLIGAVALWLFAFGKTNELVQFHLSESDDLIRSIRYSSNVLMVMVAGLICIAVANEKIISHPEHSPNVLLSLLLAGGPIAFLGAHAWYTAVELKIRPTAQVACVGTLALAGPVTLFIPGFLSMIAINLILIIFAFVFERIHAEKGLTKRELG